MISLSPRKLPLNTSKRSISEKKLKINSLTPRSLGIQTERRPVLFSRGFLMEPKSSGPMNSPPSKGSQARLEFFQSYKNLPKHKKKLKYDEQEPSANLAYLEDIHKNNLNPKPFGMINKAGNEKSIDIRFYSMGDNYAHAFSEGLKHFKTLESLNLRSNRLSEKGAYLILSNLEYHPVRFLSLSDNVLGERALECILSILRSPKPYLKHLVLESTRISANAVVSLATALVNNQSLVYLSLAKNNLQSKSCKPLKEMLHYNDKLKKLDLHWNCLKGEGAEQLFEGISENSTLEELDLSWNAIGNTKDQRIMEKIAHCLSKQTYLKHLDLSHNYITYNECEVIAEGLKENHSLIGLHIAGNECILDSKGFVIPVKETQLELGHFFTRIIESPRYTHATRMNCWICEDWAQVTFYWTPSAQEQAMSKPIFLHLECDGYKPDLMEFKSGVFELVRAVPPHKQKFFFSHLTTSITSKEYKSETLADPFEIEIKYWDECIVPMKLLTMNFINSDTEGQYYSEIIVAKPRIPSLKYSPPEEELIRLPWSIPISLFKDYKFTDSKLLSDCFEFDWNMSKLSGLVKIPAQQAQLKEILLEHYDDILNTYKILASSGGSEIYCIGPNVFSDFLNQCKLIDNLYGPSDIGVNWNSSLVFKEKGQIYNPGSALVRYEFIEILIRVANDRYCRNKICGNVIDATRKLFTDHLNNVLKFNTNSWREQEYLLEEVDLVYKAHKPILDSVFRRYSGRKTIPGQKTFMSLEEFHELCEHAKFVNEKCTSREIDLAFALSMMTQVDEVYKKRHTEMSFVEFLEALARVADVSGSVKTYPKSEKDELKELYQSGAEPKLYKKIEDKMPNLLKLCPLQLREGFVLPTSEDYKRMMYKSSIKPLNSGSSALNE